MSLGPVVLYRLRQIPCDAHLASTGDWLSANITDMRFRSIGSAFVSLILTLRAERAFNSSFIAIQAQAKAHLRCATPYTFGSRLVSMF